MPFPSSDSDATPAAEARARDLLDQSRAFADAGRIDEALAGFDQLTREASAGSPGLARVAALAGLGRARLLLSGDHDAEAETACRSVLALLERAPGGAAFAELNDRARLYRAIAVAAQGRDTEALGQLEQVVADGTDTADTWPDTLARALALQADILVRLDRGADAFRIREQLIARLADARTPWIRARVAKALLENAADLWASDRLDDALSRLDRVLCEFADTGSKADPTVLLNATYLKGRCLGELATRHRDPERCRESVALLRSIGDSYSQDDTPQARARVQNAIYHAARYAATCGDRSQALEILDSLSALAGSGDDIERSPITARGTLLRGLVLRDLGRTDEALATWERLIQEWSTELPSTEHSAVMQAQFASGEARAARGEYAAALADLHDLIARYGHESGRAARLGVAEALAAAVRIAVLKRDDDEQREAMMQLRGRLRSEIDAGVLADMSELILRSAVHLSLQRHDDAAVAILDLLTERLRSAPRDLQLLSAQAQIIRAASLARQGRVHDALAAYESTFALGADALPIWTALAQREPQLPAQQIQALLARAVTLAELGRAEAARSELDALIGRFAQDQDELTQLFVSIARIAREAMVA